MPWAAPRQPDARPLRRPDPARRHPVAIIDIGSNSVRLVAYDGLCRAPTPLYNEKVLCGLGRNVLTTGRLERGGGAAGARRPRALPRALPDHARRAPLRPRHRGGPGRRERPRLPAPPPRRPAASRSSCSRRRREAELSALGVVSGFHAPDGVVGDLGGGSLELVDVRGAVVGQGVTHAARRPRPAGPLGRLAEEGHQDRARAPEKAAPQLETLRGRTFYAVGGTWRALARLHQAARGYPVHVMHGYTVEPSDELSFLQVVEQTDVAPCCRTSSRSPRRAARCSPTAPWCWRRSSASADRARSRSRPSVCARACSSSSSTATPGPRPTAGLGGELNLLRARSPRHGEELLAWTDRFVATLGGRRPRTSAACATQPASSRISAGGRIPITGASRASTSSRTRPSSASTIRAGPTSPSRCLSATGRCPREGELDAPGARRAAPVRAGAPDRRPPARRVPDRRRDERGPRADAADRRGRPVVLRLAPEWAPLAGDRLPEPRPRPRADHRPRRAVEIA